MAKKEYKFNHLNKGMNIKNAEMRIVKINDDIENKTINVDVLFENSEATFGVNFEGFSYSNTWTQEELNSWLLSELENYIVNM